MLNLSAEQRAQLDGNGLSSESFESFWRLWPELMFDAAVGGAMDLKNGKGQERNERFAGSPAPESSTDFMAAAAENSPTTSPEAAM